MLRYLLRESSCESHRYNVYSVTVLESLSLGGDGDETLWLVGEEVGVAELGEILEVELCLAALAANCARYDEY